MNEESKNQSSRTDELMLELKEQSKQILKKVEKNDDDLCAFIIIGADDQAVVQIHTKSNKRLLLAMMQTLRKNPQLINLVSAAIAAAKDCIAIDQSAEEYAEGAIRSEQRE